MIRPTQTTPRTLLVTGRAGLKGAAKKQGGHHYKSNNGLVVIKIQALRIYDEPALTARLAQLDHPAKIAFSAARAHDIRRSPDSTGLLGQRPGGCGICATIVGGSSAAISFRRPFMGGNAPLGGCGCGPAELQEKSSGNSPSTPPGTTSPDKEKHPGPKTGV